MKAGRCAWKQQTKDAVQHSHSRAHERHHPSRIISPGNGEASTDGLDGPAILTFHAAIFVNLSWTIRRRVEANERKKWRKRLPILSKDYLRNVLRFTPLILVTTGTTWPSYDCARQPIDIGRKLTLSQLMHASINPFRLDTSGRVRARSPLLAFFFAFASLSFTWTQDGWALLRIVVEKD